MKKVLGSHAQTAHVWAQNSQAEGRASDNRMFFDRGTLYSYGRHFAIASHVKDLKGNAAILFTTESYSVSTSKHISLTRRALRSDIPVYYVPCALPDHTRDNLERFDRDIKAAIESYGKPRIRQTTRDKIASDINHLVNSRNQYGFAFVAKYKALIIPADIGLAAEKMQKEAAAKAKREAKEKALAFEKALIEAEDFSKFSRTEWAQLWREHKDDIFLMQPRLGDTARRYVSETHGVLLRIKDAATLETSQRAEFPIGHAKRAFKAVAACRKEAEGWKRNGHSIHLGHFQIDEIDAAGNVKAGCHFVKWEEIEIAAKALGII